tara:strand:- start:722 stop:958 length:237 start_codon:yes stop_codon:yes gene_type:complete
MYSNTYGFSRNPPIYRGIPGAGKSVAAFDLRKLNEIEVTDFITEFEKALSGIQEERKLIAADKIRKAFRAYMARTRGK